MALAVASDSKGPGCIIAAAHKSRGRPRKPDAERLDALVAVRLTRAEVGNLTDWAAIEGQTLTGYLRDLIVIGNRLRNGDPDLMEDVERWAIERRAADGE